MTKSGFRLITALVCSLSASQGMAAVVQYSPPISIYSGDHTVVRCTVLNMNNGPEYPSAVIVNDGGLVLASSGAGGAQTPAGLANTIAMFVPEAGEHYYNNIYCKFTLRNKKFRAGISIDDSTTLSTKIYLEAK